MVLADYRVHIPVRRVQIYLVPFFGFRARVLKLRFWQNYCVDQVKLHVVPLLIINRLFLTMRARQRVLPLDHVVNGDSSERLLTRLFANTDERLARARKREQATEAAEGSGDHGQESRTLR